MKHVLITLFCLSPILGLSQTYTHQGTTNSLGGGQSSTGNLESFIVVGEPIVSSPLVGGNFDLRAGLLWVNVAAVQPCNFPLNLAANGITDNSATLTWDESNPTDMYDVRYRLKANPPWIEITGLSDPTTAISLLESGMAYQVQVRKDCGAGNISAWSSSYEFTTTGSSVCEIPSGVTISSIGDDVATVTWESAASAITYDLRYRISGDSWNIISGIATTFYDLVGLIPGSNYQARVRSVCTADGSIKSEFSDAEDFSTTGIPACEIPTGLTATEEVVPGDVTISWNVVATALEYEVRYKIKNTQGFTTMQTTNTSILLSGLVGGATYVYAVRSICSADGSLVSAYPPNEQFVLTNGAITCDMPVNLSSVVTDNTAAISWDPVTSADHFAYRYRVKGSTTWINAQTTSNAALTGLYSGTTYQFRVRSVCTADGSIASDFTTNFEFITTGTPSCEIPTGLVVGLITENTANVNWNNMPTALEYEVRYKVQGTSGWNISYSSVPTMDLTGLLPGTKYRVKIRSVCTSDRSLYSNFSTVARFTTAGTSMALRTDSSVKQDLGEISEPILATYPNPFNDRLLIEYQVPSEGFVSIKVFSSMGKEVALIFEGMQSEGYNSYEYLPGNITPGAYYIQAMDYDGRVNMKRVILQR